jgi:hypothetical protein
MHLLVAPILAFFACQFLLILRVMSRSRVLLYCNVCRAASPPNGPLTEIHIMLGSWRAR